MAGEAWAAFEAWHNRPAKDRKVDEEYWALRDAAWEEVGRRAKLNTVLGLNV